MRDAVQNPHLISPLHTIESPVVQWLERLARSQGVVGSNPIEGSIFPPCFHLMQELIMLVYFYKQLAWWLDGCIYDICLNVTVL